MNIKLLVQSVFNDQEKVKRTLYNKPRVRHQPKPIPHSEVKYITVLPQYLEHEDEIMRRV